MTSAAVFLIGIFTGACLVILIAATRVATKAVKASHSKLTDDLRAVRDRQFYFHEETRRKLTTLSERISKLEGKAHANSPT